MKGKKLLAFTIVIVLALGVLAGCSGNNGSANKTTTPAAADKSKVSIGLVTDVGGVNDQSFNQSAWSGLKKFGQDTGADVNYIESKDASNYKPNIETFLSQNRGLIWGVGFMMGDTVQAEAKANPNTQFAIIDYAYDPKDVPNNNITGCVFAAQESSFLVGYIAGKMTKTNIVGHINGVISTTMENFAVGFYAGVLTANPKCKILGQYSNSFSDPAAGKNIANQYYAQGADIIYSAAGATGNGAIEAAKEQNKWAIGVDQDQNYLAPKNVLTSAMKRVDTAVYNVSKMYADGTLKGGQTLTYDLANNGVGYTTTGNFIPKNVINEVEAIKAKIISGEIKVPSTAAEINKEFPHKYNMPAVTQ
jgi:basic membrane protein A